MSIEQIPTPESQRPNPNAAVIGTLRRSCVRVGFAVWVLGVGMCLAASGCAKAQAKTVAEGPPLAVPEPPPRVLVPPDDEPVATAPPPEETPPAPSPRPPARPAPRRPAPAESEPRAETPAPAQSTPAPAPATVEPPRELRPLASAADPAEERKVRDVLQRASRDLKKVDYRKLSSEGKSQYEQAKRFNDQAEQAIKDRNYVFAQTLADKAAALAAELSSR